MSTNNEFECANGVKLRLRAVPSLVVLALQRQLQEPRVPVWRNEEKQRDEENPLDPAYTQALSDYQSALGEKTTDAYLANGVQVLEPLPAGIAALDSEEWAEGLKFVGLTVPDDGIGRRVAWLRWYIVGDADMASLISAIAVAGGVVTEAQVKEAADSFRSDSNGTADTTVPLTSIS